MTRLKICGITNAADAAMCAENGVHWLGFNFYLQSPRYISAGDASLIIGGLPSNVETVGILVHPTLAEAKSLLQISGVDRLQIYDPVDFDDLGVFGVPTIISYRISKNNGKHFNWLGADMILLDSYSNHVLGGSGQRFDWDLIPQEIPRDKLVLAGGIQPDNIADALQSVNPAVIDIASGAEKAPGRKSRSKVIKLIKEINRFNEQAG